MQPIRIIVLLATAITFSRCVGTCPKFVRYQHNKVEVTIKGQKLLFEREGQRPAAAYIDSQDLAQFNLCQLLKSMPDGTQKQAIQQRYAEALIAIYDTASKAAAASTPQPTAPVAPAPPLDRKPDNQIETDFSVVETAAAPGQVVLASPYLNTLGVHVTDLRPERSEVVIVNNDSLYEGNAIRPTTSSNLLTQLGTNNQSASFVLTFKRPVTSVTFMRPSLYAATSSGITHPAWVATALDDVGRELAVHSEQLTRSFTNVPAQSYTLRAPGIELIKAVRFASDPRLNGAPFAAFGAIVIERVTFTKPE